MESISFSLSVLAIIISLGAIWYARISGIAAKSSAQTAREALAFQRETSAAEQSDRQEERIASLVVEAHEKKGLYGGPFWILDREVKLSNEEQEEIVYRVYEGEGHSRERAQEALERWRAERVPKK